VSAAAGDGARLVAAMIEEMRELDDGLDLSAPDMPAAGAADLGHDIARLAAGPLQPHARGLYESEGYLAIENFNGNPVATFFREKQLSG
jgi:hypothetical protein